MGGKWKTSDDLIAIMSNHRISHRQPWVEPFLGGANVAWKAPGRKILGEYNRFLLAMWEAAANHGWSPELADINESNFNRLCALWRAGQVPKSEEAFTGLMGCMGFGGVFFSGYSRNDPSAYTAHDRAALNALNRQASRLAGSEFHACSYESLPLPDEPCLIYCDPPYLTTTGYPGNDGKANRFDSDAFWVWAGNQSQTGHTVFVSENQAPSGWTPVWEGKVGGGLSNGGGIVRDSLWINETARETYPGKIACQQELFC